MSKEMKAWTAPRLNPNKPKYFLKYWNLVNIRGNTLANGPKTKDNAIKTTAANAMALFEMNKGKSCHGIPFMTLYLIIA